MLWSNVLCELCSCLISFQVLVFRIWSHWKINMVHHMSALLLVGIILYIGLIVSCTKVITGNCFPLICLKHLLHVLYFLVVFKMVACQFEMNRLPWLLEIKCGHLWCLMKLMLTEFHRHCQLTPLIPNLIHNLVVQRHPREQASTLKEGHSIVSCFFYLTRTHTS